MVDAFVIAITCIVPLVINPIGWDRCGLPKILVIYVLCILMLFFYFIKLRKKAAAAYAPDYLILGYTLLVTLSTFFSVNIALSLIGRPLRWEGFAAVFCYVFIYFISSKYYIPSKIHLKFFIISGTLIAIYGIAQFYGYEIFKYDPRKLNWTGHSFSTIGNRNFLGSYLVLLLPISMYYYIFSKKIGYLFTSIILYSCLLCTLTRGAWIGFAFLLIFFIFYILKYRINIKHFLIMLAVFAVATYTIDATSNGSLFSRTFSLKSDVMDISSDKAGSNRIFIWKNSLKLIPNSPILGSGPDTLGEVFMEKFGEEAKVAFNDDDIIVDKAHNEYLQQAVTTGIPSMIIYIAFGLTILIRAHKNIKSNKLLIPLFCSILGYAVQAFFNISVVSVAPIMWALLGITANLAYAENTQSQVQLKEIAC